MGRFLNRRMTLKSQVTSLTRGRACRKPQSCWYRLEQITTNSKIVRKRVEFYYVKNRKRRTFTTDRKLAQTSERDSLNQSTVLAS